jgi:hypothetical protein
MKKVLLRLAFVLATSSSAVNASSSDEIVSTTSAENIEIVEEFGCASDCVTHAVGFVTWAADGDDLNGELHDLYMWMYHRTYENCYYANCG